MRLIFLCILIVLMRYSGLAQTNSRYTQYLNNQMLINAASVGSKLTPEIKFGNRWQWAGLEGAPRSGYISFQTSFSNNDVEKVVNFLKYQKFKNRSRESRNVAQHGFGGLVWYDKTGIFNQNSFNLYYSYHIPVFEGHKLAAGASSQFYSYSVSRDSDPNDPALYRVEDASYTDFSIGLFLYSTDHYLGVSINSIRDKEIYNNLSGSKIFILSSGFEMDISPQLSIVPSVVINRYFHHVFNARVFYDINLMAKYNEMVWSAVSKRSAGEWVFLIGGYIIKNKVDLNYTYEDTISRNNYLKSSHELSLTFYLGGVDKVQCPTILPYF
ncbi:MAG: PorP/SprF family type IX secretion system membrane protein [Cyclobacteriaceae bacterium]